MTVSRTVNQTIAGVLATYQKDIEQAAGDKVLSKAEEAKLSPFAKKHIEEVRKAGQALSVAKATAALKPAITRAVTSIAGADGRVDEFEVSKLRVPELRTRAATLFTEAPGPGEAELIKALADVNIAPITDFGRNFDLGKAPKGSTLESMVAAIAQFDPSQTKLSDWATISTGKDAVADFTSVIRTAGKDIADNAEDPTSGADLKHRLDTLADSVESFFKPGDYTQLVNVSHAIVEDGDVEYNILMAQQPDGTWKTITHTDFPF